MSKKLKLRPKNTIIDRTLTYASEEWTLTKNTTIDRTLTYASEDWTLTKNTIIDRTLTYASEDWTLTKNTIIDRALTYASEDWTLTKRDRKQINIFERKVYRRILGPVYDNEKENWRILTNKEVDAMVKNATITETIRLNRLR